MAVEVDQARRLFTREEYRQMAEAGILKPTERVELIRGEIIQMSPPGRRHVAFVDNLTQLLILKLQGRAIVSVQNPVVLDESSEPQPDLAMLQRRSIPYKEVEASAADVLLLIEVADTSLRYDRRTKLRLYAEAGVPEYWIVDCAAEAVDVFRAPEADAYGEETRVTGSGTIHPAAFPDVAISLVDLFA
jgi:Uma2 family endonuclease